MTFPWHGREDLDLDDDARRMLITIHNMLPRPFHELGVAGARAAVAGMRPDKVDPVMSVIDTAFPGRHGPVPVRIYRTADAVQPVIVYLHGGGWTMGSLNGVDACCRRMANLSGCAVVSVDYRLAPEHPYPVPLDDCYDVVQYVADNGARHALDGTRVAMAGDSAGGNLAIAVCIRARDSNGPNICAHAVAYPVFDLPEQHPSEASYAAGPVITAGDLKWFIEHYLPDHGDRKDPWAIPANAQSLSCLPPAVVVSAAHDPLRDHAYEYIRRLRASDVDVEESSHRGSVHGFFTEVGTLSAADTAVADVARFLRNHLRKPTNPSKNSGRGGQGKERQ